VVLLSAVYQSLSVASLCQRSHRTAQHRNLTPPQPRGSLRSPRPSRSDSRRVAALTGARRPHRLVYL